MRKTRSLVRNRHFTSIQQASALKSRYNFNNSIWSIRPHGFTCFFDVTPTPLSDTYRLKIEYNEPFMPQVYVVTPKPLELAQGAERLPHTYNTKRQRLCLFRPYCGEWNSSMLIADTIIHWAIEWLYYYENWIYTGKWSGGGHGNWYAEYIADTHIHAG